MEAGFLLKASLKKPPTAAPITIPTGPTKDAPKNLKPWFEHELKILNNNNHLIFGHWAALDGVTTKKNISALDTGCAWGNKLTAMRLEDNEIFSCGKLI